VVKTFTVVVNKKFEPLLVDHLGGGHSQSMEKLLKNSTTSKGGGAHTYPPMEFPLYYYILFSCFIIYCMYLYSIFQILRYFTILLFALLYIFYLVMQYVLWIFKI
jgi:hypothetical protein